MNLNNLIDQKRTHRVKLHPNYCDRIISGQKTFEIRKNDRDYQVGDRLSMYPFVEGLKFSYPGMESRNIEADVIYFTTAYQQDGYCVLGIKLIEVTK